MKAREPGQRRALGVPCASSAWPALKLLARLLGATAGAVSQPAAAERERPRGRRSGAAACGASTGAGRHAGGAGRGACRGGGRGAFTLGAGRPCLRGVGTLRVEPLRAGGAAVGTKAGKAHCIGARCGGCRLVCVKMYACWPGGSRREGGCARAHVSPDTRRHATFTPAPHGKTSPK